MNTRRQGARAPNEGSTAVDPLIGATIGGRYKIRQLIARGGVGLVYLAQQREPDREVVVKVLAPNWIDDVDTVARFEREGQRLGAVQHPNIVSLYECGHENGVAYLAMEYLVGELLGDFLARKGGRLSTEEFVPIAAQILKGLGYAHSRGMMHRDIKPSNIMLCVRKGRANFVKILDFGMAKLIAGERDITAEQIVGTANFLSPEQIKGEAVDARVDVYALGVLFYGMLSGRFPFDADNNAAILYRHVNEPPPPLRQALEADGATHDVSDGLIELVMQCLEKDPEARPADADAMVEALIDCVQASMFHLPLADTSVNTIVSSASLAAPAINVAGAELGQTEVSSASLSVASALAAGRERPPTLSRTRPPTGSRLRPPTHSRLRPPTMPPNLSGGTAGGPAIGFGGDPHAAIVTLEAAAVASPRGNWGLVVGALVALLIGGVIAAVYVLGDRSQPGAARVAAGTELPNKARTTEVLDQVDAEILAGEFDHARESLDAASVAIDAVPEFKARANRQRDRIAVATTFASAQRLEKEGKVAAALGSYQDILAIDPSHLDARAAVARLREANAGPTTTLGPSSTPTPTGKLPPRQPGQTGLAGKPGKPGRPGAPEVTTPEKPPEPEKPAPKPPEEEDPFLPVAKQDDGGIFLPVGGKK